MRGIIIPCPEKYEILCLVNIFLLRQKFECKLPIEVWEVGNEITPATKDKMKQHDVIFRNVNDYCSNPAHWKGFQVKVFALYHTTFDEVILCDADVTFYKSPEIIFDDENYRRTGAYFFKDLDQWVFHDLRSMSTEKFTSLEFFSHRKRFIRELIPSKPDNFPKEWAYIYDAHVPTAPVKEALQESGVVYIDKRVHKESLEYIYKLNDLHQVTYQYVWGDKETFWLGCLMAKKDFYFNPSAAYTHTNNKLTHNYGGGPFWRQK
jgi:hypothetical protein